LLEQTRPLDHREFPVLYVDDEPENLRIFELTFRREFQVVTAASGAEGLEILNGRPVALVLSDHRMPGMTGVDFLARVRELDPKTVRILVTAYGDAETLGAAINNGSIYRFVPKPWTPEEMRVTLRRGVETWALERDRERLLREATLLNRVSRSLNQELALEPLLDLVLGTAIDQFGYDAAALLFLDPKREELAFRALAPPDPELEEALRRLAIGRATAPDFLRRLLAGETQQLTLEQALGCEPPVRAWVAEVAAEELLVVPLLGKQGATGALAVDNRRGGRRFGPGDRTLLEGLCNQAVIAIDNARLVEALRRSREQILRADRLGTLGTLAAGLAHEINNPLVSIHTFLALAPLKRLEDDPEFWGSYHELAAREVDRIRRLVDSMRRLGQGGGESPPREGLDLLEVAEAVQRLLAPQAQRAGVTLDLERGAGASKVVAVRDEIQQLLTNLVLNAIQASPAGARVRIRAGADPGGETSCIEVQDQGPGIPEEDLERIFDPFFTTKGPDQGSGLGLMICHRIASDHGGSIEVMTREGSGATFRVRLPAAPAHGQGAGAAPARAASLDPSRRG
jgi:two-component system NtrC family sensor kinase